MSNPGLSIKTRLLLLIIFISFLLVSCKDSEYNHLEEDKYTINYSTETGSGEKVKKRNVKNYENETKGENEQ